jgi:hypothetical protein
MMFGSMQILPVLGELNAAFGGKTPRINSDHGPTFAPGTSLGPALADVLDSSHEELRYLLNAYLEMLPGSMRESLRSIIHYALTQDPQVLLNFAWAPSYDFEMTIWEMVEPAPAQSGVTILLKGRYPDHASRFAPAAAS